MKKEVSCGTVATTLKVMEGVVFTEVLPESEPESVELLQLVTAKPAQTKIHAKNFFIKPKISVAGKEKMLRAFESI